MTVLLLTVMAALLLAVAGYAQYRVGFHTAGRRKTLLTRGVLALVGLAFGYVTAVNAADDRMLMLLTFLAGFGVVHVPAAVILFVKQARGAGRS